MSLFIRCLNIDYRLPDTIGKNISVTVEVVLEDYNLPGGEVSLILVDDQYIKSLNKKYRGKDAPTDVLSFPYLDHDSGRDADGEEFPVGDILISIDRIREQALDAGHSQEREIALLTVHGLLHLLGYDHEEEEEKKVMQSKEREIVERIDF